MIDPLTALSVASAAVSQMKTLMGAGRDASQAISKFAGAFSDVQEAHRRATNPPWYKSFSGSVEEEAARAFAAKKKIEAMRKEVEDTIRWVHGPSGLEEYKNIIRDIRKRRQQHEYKQQRIKQSIIEWTVGGFLILLCAALIGWMVYIIGVEKGKW